MNALPGLVVCFLSVGIVRAQTDHFWLDAEINNRPARLMFDTGTEGTGLFPEAVKRLGLTIDVPVPDIPSKHGKVGAGKTKLAELKVAGTSLRTRLFIFPQDLESYDLHYDGLVGWPEVRDNVFLMEASTLTLKSVGQVAQEAATWTRFRVLTNNDILALEMPGPETTRLLVDIDTGKPCGVTLSPQRWQQWITAHPGRPRTLRAYRMFGTGNQVKEESWADEIALGSLVLTDVPVMEANSAEVALGSTGYAAALGMAALKRLDLVIDGKNNVAYVRSKRTAAAAYSHNRLGAVFVQEPSQGIALFAHVAPGSPAAEAGIRDGDVLLKVNGHDVAGLTTDPSLVPLILEWDRPAATRFEFTLERGIEVRKTTAVLRDILQPGKTPSPPAKVLASEVKWLMDLADTAYRETNYDQAINNYAEVIRLKPDAAEAFNGRGGAYYFKGSNDLALADFNEAIRLKPDFDKAFNNRGTLSARAWHDQDKAIADYTVAIRLKPDDAETFYNRGNSYGINGDVTRALADFDEAIRLNPKYARAFVDRGISCQKLGEYGRAFQDFSEAIRLQPEFAQAYAARGTLQLLTNNFEAGIRDLSVAIRFNPADADALSNRGSAYWRTGAFDPAIADLTEALRLKPGSARILINRGSAYAGKGENDRAIADFSRAIQIDPKNVTALACRASAYYSAQDYAKAVADYNEVARSAPNDAGLFNNRGLAFEGEGKHDEAIVDFTEAIRLNPSLAAAIGNRGNAYKQRKDYAHALSDYERVLQLEPANPAGYRTLAQALAACPDDSRRDGKKAVQYALKACELASWKDAATIDILAMAYAANGDFSEAIKWEQTFLRVTLPEDVRASALARLKLYQQNKPYTESGL